MSGRKLKVLVTGSSGLIGGILARTLSDKYAQSGLDGVPPDPAPDIPTTRADVGDFDAIRPAFDSMDAVVHLAAGPSPRVFRELSCAFVPRLTPLR